MCDVKLGHSAFVMNGEIDLTALGLGTFPSTGTQTLVDVIQHGIGTQTAYQRETDFSHSLENGSVEKATLATSSEVIVSKLVRYFSKTDIYLWLSVISLAFSGISREQTTRV